MKPTKILLLSCPTASDLSFSLKRVLEAEQSFNFELREEILWQDQLTRSARVLTQSIADFQPNLAIFCLPQSRSQDAAEMFGVVRRHLGEVPIVIATGTLEPMDLYKALELGAADFITPPFRQMDVLPRLWRLRQQHPNADDCVVAQLKERLGLKQLVGKSPALLAQIRKIPPIARCDASVLITGESGTGKEMFARAIHFLSPRSAKTFSAVTCGALPVDLVENELFGHEPGAYTGANSSSVGLLRGTDGGSLFLDEIDSLPLLAQAKLLRFLQEKEIRPLGTHKPCRVDVRVIAASNLNLAEAVRKGAFRGDLFFRLNVVALTLPPLRERKEDIALLAHHFVAKYASAFDTPARNLSTAALQKLMLYEWPGNVRELENVIEGSVIFCPQAVIRPEDISLPVPAVAGEESFQTLKAKLIAQFERGYVQELLRANHGNITKAAMAAGKHRRAFWEVMRKHRIDVQLPACN